MVLSGNMYILSYFKTCVDISCDRCDYKATCQGWHEYSFQTSVNISEWRMLYKMKRKQPCIWKIKQLSESEIMFSFYVLLVSLYFRRFSKATKFGEFTINSFCVLEEYYLSPTLTITTASTPLLNWVWFL